MNNENKSLLLQDLSARLPYGVIVQYKGHNTIIKNKLLTGSDLDCNMEYYKPYLRPMSSMTEEERKEYNDYLFYGVSIGLMSNTATAYELIDFLNTHHLDYHGLIEKCLAIEVTENNNPYKE